MQFFRFLLLDIFYSRSETPRNVLGQPLFLHDGFSAKLPYSMTFVSTGFVQFSSNFHSTSEKRFKSVRGAAI